MTEVVSGPALAPEPRVVTVIDYDITLNSGKELPSFTLRPDFGDTETFEAIFSTFVFAKTKHKVAIRTDQIAMLSRRERDIKLPVEKFKPTAAPAKTDE